MLVEQGAFGHAHIDIRHADQNADAAIGQLFCPFDLVEILGCVVVDGGPEKVAKILCAGRGGQLRMRFDGSEFGVSSSGKIGLKSFFNHFGMCSCHEVKVQILGGMHRELGPFKVKSQPITGR